VIVLPVLLQLALGCPRRLCRGISHALCNLLAPHGVRSDIMPHRPPVPHPCDCVVAVDGDIHWRIGFPVQQRSGLLQVVSQLCDGPREVLSDVLIAPLAEGVRPAEVVCRPADPVVLLERYLERGIIFCWSLVLIIALRENATFPP
jgi:hypothetical protein